MLNEDKSKSDYNVLKDRSSVGHLCARLQGLMQSDWHEAHRRHHECGRIKVQDMGGSDHGDTDAADSWSDQEADIRRALNQCIGGGQVRARREQRNSRCQCRTEYCGNDRDWEDEHVEPFERES